ncbi:MAG TPA: ATP-binding cassette domain-containing protein, partial [Burkholderiales bacterium]
MSISVPKGQVVAIMGASGSGKTTVLRLMGGSLRPTRGTVRVFGQSLNRMRARELYELRRDMGMLFQFGALFTDLSVFENVAFPIRERTDLPEAIVRDLVLMKLEAVGLRGAAQMRPQ